MKVAIYSGSIPATTFVEHLIGGLADRGVEVYVFGKVNGKYSYENKLVQVFKIPSGKANTLFFVFKSLLKLLLKNYHLLKQVPAILSYGKPRSFTGQIMFLGRILPILLHPPDIFHIQWVKSIDDYIWVKTILNKKIVVSLRGAHINYSPLADQALAAKFRKYFPQVDFFHGVSKAIICEAEKYNLDTAHAVVINPAIDKRLLENPPKANHTSGQLQILSVGRFHWKKGYHFALDALKIIDKKGIDFIYTIIAGGNHEEIQFQVHSLGLENKVKIIKGLPHGEVLKKMLDADVFLLPSVEEGIANVVLEAMANGVPVISTDCGGMAEVIMDKQNGFLVPVRDPKAMAVAIEDFLELKEEQIKLMIENGRKTIQDRHLLENQVESFVKLYEKVLAIDHHG